MFRNAKRVGKERIPDAGLRGCYAKLELPHYEEGFDKLYHVSLNDNKFIIEDWKDEV